MTFRWDRQGIEDLTWRTLEGEKATAIASGIGCAIRTVQDMQAELGLIARQVLVNSAKVEVDFLEAIDSSEATEFFDMKRIEDRRSLATVPEPRQRRLAV